MWGGRQLIGHEKDRKIDSKGVAQILKVSLEVVTYLRKECDLPHFVENRYILHWEREVYRWRNRQLAKNSKFVMDIEQYYTAINLARFCDFKKFRAMINRRTWLEGNRIIKYINKQDVEREVMNTVADIISEYNMSIIPRCSACGRIIHTTLPGVICHFCKKSRAEGRGFASERKGDNY